MGELAINHLEGRQAALKPTTAAEERRRRFLGKIEQANPLVLLPPRVKTSCQKGLSGKELLFSRIRYNKILSPRAIILDGPRCIELIRCPKGFSPMGYNNTLSLPIERRDK